MKSEKNRFQLITNSQLTIQTQYPSMMNDSTYINSTSKPVKRYKDLEDKYSKNG